MRGAHYLLKQSTDAAKDATVKREALVYLSLSQIPNIAPYLPRFFCYDADENVLVLEYLRGMKDLSRYYAEGGRISVAISSAMGRALGLLHRTDIAQLDRDVALPSEAPWILAVHQPSLRSLREVSPANLELIRIVQAAPAFCEKLDALRTAWQLSSLIHMDLRWNNWLVKDSRSAKNAPAVKLLDWETACFGDPRWDTGCELSDHLMWWALQTPEAGGEVSRRSAGEDITPILQRVIQAFWFQYCEMACLKPTERAPFLSAALQYAGARLIQSAYERLQQSQSLDRFSVSLLQLAANILEFPEIAVETFCGFGLENA